MTNNKLNTFLKFVICHLSFVTILVSINGTDNSLIAIIVRPRDDFHRSNPSEIRWGEILHQKDVESLILLVLPRKHL